MLSNRLYDKYKTRLNLFKIIIFFCTIVILINFFSIQIFSRNLYKKQISIQTTADIKKEGDRGKIYDRNNNLLASEIKKCVFWINTTVDSIDSNNKIKSYNTLQDEKSILEIDKQAIIKLFSNNFSKNDKYYKNLLNQNKPYIEIEDNLIVADYYSLINEAKNIQSLKINYYNHRLYPYNELAAQVIGFTDKKNNGSYGIEIFFNDILRGSTKNVEYGKSANGKIIHDKNTILPKNGADLFLTIDIQIQKILQEALEQTVKDNHAKSANGIIVNPYNGEIIAMASIPVFDLNNYSELNKKFADRHYKNRVISAYEPGSTFKIICFSQALDYDLEKINKKYFCEKGQYKGKYIDPFEDHIKGWDSLNFSDIFIRSSNIGTVKIFEDLSSKSFYDKIQKFGFGIKTNISLPNEHSGQITDFKNYSKKIRDLASTTIGQSILVTNLQMAMAYSSIANGGYLIKPKIIKKINYDNDYSLEFNKPIVLDNNINSNTSEFLLSILEKTITDTNGTAANAYSNYIRIGGKTGTAEIWDKNTNQYSSEEFISSFASIFPINNPKYVMIVSIEAPIYEKRWGSQSAVPCAKKIIEDIIFYDKNIIKSLKYAEKNV